MYNAETYNCLLVSILDQQNHQNSCLLLAIGLARQSIKVRSSLKARRNESLPNLVGFWVGSKDESLLRDKQSSSGMNLESSSNDRYDLDPIYFNINQVDGLLAVGPASLGSGCGIVLWNDQACRPEGQSKFLTRVCRMLQYKPFLL